MIRFAAGLVLMFLVALIDIRVWMRYAYLIYAVPFVLRPVFGPRFPYEWALTALGLAHESRSAGRNAFDRLRTKVHLLNENTGSQ